MIHVGRSLNNWYGTDPSDVSTGCTAQQAVAPDNGVCAYQQPANGTYGNAEMGTERTPGYQSADASVSKAFTIFHEQRITFRADAANVMNMTSLSNPNATISSSTFGQITGVRSGPRKAAARAEVQF